MLITAMAIFGTLGIFVRHITVSSGELALYRAMMASLLLTGYFVVTKQRFSFRAIGKELPLLLLSGFAMGINWILLFEAYRYTTVSVATLSYYFAPVLVTAVSPILFRERLSKKQLLCFVMSTLGLSLVIGVSSVGTGKSDTIGICFGLGAAVFYATVILLNKQIKNVAGIQRTFLQFLAASLVLLPYVIGTSGITVQQLDGLGWGCLLVVGLFHTGVTYCLYFSALKDLSGQETAILSYIDPLVAVFVSVALLGEQMTLLQLLGGILILGFTLWNEIEPQKK